MSWEIFKQNVFNKLNDASKVPSTDFVANVYATEYDACIRRPGSGDIVNKIPLSKGNVQGMKSAFLLALNNGTTTPNSYDLIKQFGTGIKIYWTGASMVVPTPPLVTVKQLAAGAVANVLANSNSITDPGVWQTSGLSVSPNNNPLILINNFINTAKQHLLTVKGLAVCTTTYQAGITLPGLADWQGYSCEPQTPGGVEQIVPVSNTEFDPNKPLTAVEIEYYKEDINEQYAVAYPKEVESAPIYNGLKTRNSGNTANTSFVASGIEARTIAERYLGRNMTDTEWSNLVSATYAEAGRNQTEIAHVVATILNRTRTKFTPLGPANPRYKFNTVTDILYQWRQFEAITGNPSNGNQPSPNFLQGPPRNSEVSIYGSIKNILPSVDKKIIRFTSNNDCLYVRCSNGEVLYQNGRVIKVEGRSYDYLLNMRKKATSKIIGSSIFSD